MFYNARCHKMQDFIHFFPFFFFATVSEKIYPNQESGMKVLQNCFTHPNPSLGQKLG